MQRPAKRPYTQDRTVRRLLLEAEKARKELELSEAVQAFERSLRDQQEKDKEEEDTLITDDTRDDDQLGCEEGMSC